MVPVGSKVKIHYIGKLDGRAFDNSYQRDPMQFVLGGRTVIRGWDEGIAQLCKGQKAILICPPEYAYGEAGVGTAMSCVIPPNATLHFEVEVIDFEPPVQHKIPSPFPKTQAKPLQAEK